METLLTTQHRNYRDDIKVLTKCKKKKTESRPQRAQFTEVNIWKWHLWKAVWYNIGLSALSPFPSEINQLNSAEYSEDKVIYLATMTTLITRFTANMDTPIKKSNIIYLLLILLWNPTHTEQCHHSVLFCFFLNGLSLFGIWSKVYSVDLLRAEVEIPWMRSHGLRGQQCLILNCETHPHIRRKSINPLSHQRQKYKPSGCELYIITLGKVGVMCKCV